MRKRSRKLLRTVELSVALPVALASVSAAVAVGTVNLCWTALQRRLYAGYERPTSASTRYVRPSSKQTRRVQLVGDFHCPRPENGDGE